MKYRFKILISAFVVLAVTLVFLFGPNKLRNSSSQYMENHLTSVQLDNQISSLEHQYLVEDGSIIFLQFQDNIATYFRYYPQDSSKIKIDAIPNFLAGMNSVCRMGDDLYFYVAVGNDINFQNVLFSINLNSNTLSSHDRNSNDHSLVGLSVYPLKKSIVTLKNIVNDDKSITTFFEFYNTENNQWYRDCEKTWHSYNQPGSAIFAIYADGNNLYSLQDDYDDEGGIETKIIVYDSSINIDRSYILDGDILDFIHTGRIKKLSINNGFIYMMNTSSYGYLGKITDGEIQTVFSNMQYLEIADSSISGSEDLQLYYIRRANLCYVVDPKTSSLEKITLLLEDWATIRKILTNRSSVFLDCYVEDAKTKLYPEVSYFCSFDDLVTKKLK